MWYTNNASSVLLCGYIVENLIWLISPFTDLSVSFAFPHASLHFISLFIFSLDPSELPDMWFFVSQSHSAEKPLSTPSVLGHPSYIFAVGQLSTPYCLTGLPSSCYLCFCTLILFDIALKTAFIFPFFLVVKVPRLTKVTSLLETLGFGLLYL